MKQTIQVTVDLNTIEVPYNYAFTSTSTCVSFSNQSGTSSSATLTTEVSFTNDDCLADNPIYVQLIGSNGCNKSQQIQVPNPCSNLNLNVTQLEDYKFQASVAAPGCSSVIVDWTFNDNIFNVQNQQDSSFLSTIELDFNTSDVRGRIPLTNSITATVNDCNDCNLTVTKTFPICKPEIEDKVIFLACYSNPILGFTHTSSRFKIEEPTNCTSTVIMSPQWSLPDNFNVTSLTIPGDATYYSITANGVEPGTYTGTYTLRDIHGIPSNEGVLTLVVRSCTENNTITIPDKRINIDCNTVTPGDTIEINVENELIVDSSAVVDWSTWTLIDPPTPNSPSIVLTTNTSGDHVIQYETNSPTILNDVFAWTVCDTNGNCAQASVYTIVECITGPVTVADADCVECGSSVTIDVLANDTSSGPLDVNTVQIEANPTNGTVDVNSDGTIIYTPNNGWEGVDTFDYSVADTLGERSASATVTVTTICAGEDTEVIICNS